MWRRATSFSPLISSFKSSFFIQIASKQKIWEMFTTGIPLQERGNICPKHRVPFITFVLGGPGSGKGTQCAKIVDTFGFKHLSAGDLLRKEIASHSEYGSMILNTIREGKIVPSEVTVKLLRKEMESSDNHKFLIDGFPRSEENRRAFEEIMEAEPDVVLFFHCPEEEMVKRVLSRNQGRIDDNIDTVRKRLKVFEELNLPVIEHYAKRGKLHKINAVGTVDEIFEQVRPVFAAYEVRTFTMSLESLSRIIFLNSSRITILSLSSALQHLLSRTELLPNPRKPCYPSLMIKTTRQFYPLEFNPASFRLLQICLGLCLKLSLNNCQVPRRK